MRALFVAAAAAGLVASGALGQEGVTFKNYAAKVGDRTRTTETEHATTATTVLVMGQEKKMDEQRGKTVVYTQEVLAVGAGMTKPAKVRRVYEKAVETFNGAESKLPLNGLTVVAERKGDKYTFTLADGTAPTGNAAAALEKEFDKKGNSDEEFFPKTPIKAGDSWDLTEKVAKDFLGDNSFGVDMKAAKVTGKLLSVTKKGGAVVGDVAVTANLPLTELRGKQSIKLNPGSVMTLDMKGTGTLDGTSPEGTLTMKTRIALAGPFMGVDLKMNIDLKQTSTTERVK